MLRLNINIVAYLGILGMLVGMFGEATFLLCGCLLVSAALIAAAIASQKPQ